MLVLWLAVFKQSQSSLSINTKIANMTRSDSLPPTPEGHVRYNMIPWKRNRGYAKSPLSQLQAIARGFNIPYLELVTDMANLASQRSSYPTAVSLLKVHRAHRFRVRDERISVVDHHPFERPNIRRLGRERLQRTGEIAPLFCHTYDQPKR